MAQNNDVACPICQHLLSIVPDKRGEPASCPKCGHVFEPARAGQPLVSILQQLEELQQELARTPPPPPPRMPLSSEVQLQVSTPAAQAIVVEQVERLTRELDAVRGERDQLHSRQQALALETAQLRIVVSEYETAQTEIASARLTAFRALGRALDGARLRWDNERKTLEAQAQQREQSLLEEVERRIQSEQERATAQVEELRRESAQERAALQQTLDELKEQHATKSSEYQSLSRLRDELESTHKERESHWQERQEVLQRDLEQAKRIEQGRQDEWREQLDSHQQEREALQAELEAHKKQQQALRQELEQHKREREAAVKHRDSMVADWKDLSARHEKVQTALQELEERLTSESGIFGRQLEQAQQERDEARQQSANRERELAGLHARLQEQTRSEQDSATRLARMQKDLETVYHGHQQQQSALTDAEERLRPSKHGPRQNGARRRRRWMRPADNSSKKATSCNRS